jgi:hypothetical protein
MPPDITATSSSDDDHVKSHLGGLHSDSGEVARDAAGGAHLAGEGDPDVAEAHLAGEGESSEVGEWLKSIILESSTTCAHWALLA